MSGIKGLDSFLDVLALVKDPAKYDAKIKELQKEIAQYTSVVEAVVKLSKVNDYTTSIREREEASKQALTAAKQEAEGMLAHAIAEADRVRKESNDAKAKAALLLEKATLLEKELDKKNQSLVSLEAQIAKREAAVADVEAKLADAVAALETKKAKLLSVLG